MKMSVLGGGVVKRLRATKTKKETAIPHTGGQIPKGFAPVIYMVPTEIPPITMLQNAPSAVAFFQKKVPQIDGSCMSRPPEAIEDSIAIILNLYWANTRQIPVITGINVLLRISSFCSER